MKFDGYYNNKRLRFLDKELREQLCDYKGHENYRKTACFYSDKFNFYIDTSDGVNEDIGINEYTNRIKWIVQDCNGKPFIMFKTSYSKERTKDIIEIAENNNGKVLPYFVMSYYKEFDETLAMKDYFRNLKVEKEYDIGFCASLYPYFYPNKKGDNQQEYLIKSRENLYSKLSSSKFKFFHGSNLKHLDYLHESKKWKVHFSVPGVGEYSGRLLEGALMGECVIQRKNSYDNAVSYKNIFPEIDFEKENWQDDLKNIIDNFDYWSEKAEIYFDEIYQPKRMVQYLWKKINENV